jgi:O-antigen/teichoic acid export membrane protein
MSAANLPVPGEIAAPEVPTSGIAPSGGSSPEAGGPGHIGGKSSVFKSLLGRGGQLALNVLTGVLTARMLKPAGRGELAAMILWPIFLSGAFTLGLPNALLYTLRSKRRRDATLITAAMLIAMLLSVLTAVLGILLLPHWLSHYPANIVRAAQWFMISTPATILLLVGRATWEARGRFGTSSASLVSASVMTLAGLLLLLGIHRLTPITAACTYVLAGLPPLVWIVISLRSELVLRAGEMADAVKDLLSYGLRSYGIDLCGSLSQYVDQALVLGMLMPSDMGTYTVALSLSRMINVVFTSTASVVFPKAMGLDAHGGLRLALRALVGSLAIAVPGAILLVLGSSLALRLLYGSTYAIASGLFRVLLVEALISGSVSVMSQPFMALGRPGTVTLLQVSGLAATVPLIFLLVPRMGPEGACYALLISACLRVALLRYCYNRSSVKKVSMLRLAWFEAKTLTHLFARYLQKDVTVTQP